MNIPYASVERSQNLSRLKCLTVNIPAFSGNHLVCSSVPPNVLGVFRFNCGVTFMAGQNEKYLSVQISVRINLDLDSRAFKRAGLIGHIAAVIAPHFSGQASFYSKCI